MDRLTDEELKKVRIYPVRGKGGYHNNASEERA